MKTASLWQSLTRPVKDLCSVIGAFRNWPTYLIHYFGLSRQRYMEIKLRKHNLRVRSVGQGWEFHSLYCLMFEGDEYRVQKYDLPSGSTIVDIGAHIGWFTLSASHIPDVRIFCYEPFPENYRLLTENLQLNGLTRCRAFQMAVAPSEGEATFHHSRLSTGGTLLADGSPLGLSIEGSYKVQTTTLEGIFAANQIEKCDLLKIDCEGIEHDILAAASHETLRRIERISIEVDHIDEKKNMRSLSMLLKDRGYTVDMGGRWGNILYAVRAGGLDQGQHCSGFGSTAHACC